MAVSLADPSWFPIDFDAAGDAFVMQALALDRIGETAFLDQRMGLALEGERLATTAVRVEPGAPPPAFLFHTAFCGSTLLARALHAPPRSVALKEPLVLMKLTAAFLAARSAQDLEACDMRLAAAIALLGRAWTEGGRVLVKPTNVVNALMPRILRAGPRAVLLYSSLREFLISCCKKLPQAETRIRWMAQSLIHGTRLQQSLGVSSGHPFNFVEACVLTWYAQIERYADALAADGSDALRSLDMQAMFAAPAAAVAASARWMQLDGALDGVDERVAREFSRNAKATAEAFDPAQREREKAGVLARYEALVRDALAWAQGAVEPHASVPRDWKPLAIDAA